MALALATAAGTTRVLETASTTAAGLTAAATAELGRDGAGWILGSRGLVRIERVGDILHGPEEVPTPTPGPECDLLVVDIAWEVGAVLSGHGWLTTLLDCAGPVVLTASATLPGLRRLDSALSLLRPNRPVVALGGSVRAVTPTGGQRRPEPAGRETTTCTTGSCRSPSTPT